jgi:hypothetical protein
LELAPVEGICRVPQPLLEHLAAARASALELTRRVDFSDQMQDGLKGMRVIFQLDDTFVLRDHRKLRRAPELVLSDRVQHLYPELVTGVANRMFHVDNPHPKPGLRRIVAGERKRVGVRRRDLVRDGWTGFTSYG